MKLTLNVIKNNKTSALFLLLFALAASNFMLYGAYLFIAVGLLYLAVSQKSVVIQKAVIPVFLFALFYFIFTTPSGSLWSGLKIFACPLLWLVGYSMPDGKSADGILRVSMYLAMGMAVHGALNLIFNLFVGIKLSSGVSLDIWSGVVSSATGQLINFSLFVAFAGGLVFFGKNKLVKIGAILFYLLTLYYDVQIGGRTFLVLSLISFAGAGLCYLYYTAKWKNLKKTVTVVTTLLIVVLLLIFCFQNNVFGIKDIYENSYLYQRFDYYGADNIISDSRLSLKRSYLENIEASLWGGRNLKNKVVGSYAHDLWLDTYDEAGILTLLALLIYTVMAVWRVWKVIRGNIEFKYKAWLGVYIVVVMLQFFVEPILQGAPMLLFSFIMIDGMMAKRCEYSRYGDEYKEKKDETE